ncbi:cation:proton antiporter [Candidatus Liberibacter americanus]|uniref:Kef-type K+ transport system, NAD-binding component n=1 Tax=Candidatus Liberibacter americanus str. Sao Paulo TaxID=1261131 RepID=U6B693_9HYPH|nr:cation:proton antiporter [Candidatus Liberibacter americanus]AHA28294.1 Kef-type K+ transport system, NAD-binding component [Candidatus Liberibacter americanus str. Sao Paulo]EMS36586.1 potassium-efflux system protein [Candidatus Liberibacter americanus PW_SP]
MTHSSFISTIIWGFVLSFIFGAIANRCRLPTLVGYLVAGILVGPRTPGFIASESLVPALAEIGIILLMFGVGLHFSVKDLLSVRGVALPGAIIQIALGTLFGVLMGQVMGWSIVGSIVFGLALSVASTVVLLTALQENRILETDRGKIAVGWLIVEDLIIVLALVFIPAMASIGSDKYSSSDPLVFIVNQFLGYDIGILGLIVITLLKVLAFVGAMLVIGRRVIPWILHTIFFTGSRELFRLGVLAIALGFAYGSAKLFGVSLSLGAFFAGMILAESELSHNAAQESLPLRDAFSVLFFISVGMMFNPDILLSNPMLLLMTVIIVVLGKSLIAFIICIAFGRSVSTALTISASLAQIGEFSFILAGLGVEFKMLPDLARDLILGAAIISIILNPLVFILFEYIQPMIVFCFAKYAGNLYRHGVETVSSSRVEADLEPDMIAESKVDQEDVVVQNTELVDHAILVGYGRIGKIIGQNLKAAGISILVIEDSEKEINELRGLGIEVIYGNATIKKVLLMANIVEARSLVISIPNAFETAYITQEARSANPSILIISLADSEAEVEHLTRYGADTVVIGSREIAFGMLDRLNQVHHESITYD